MKYRNWQLEVLKKIRGTPTTVRDLSGQLEHPILVLHHFIDEEYQQGNLSRVRMDLHARYEYAYTLLRPEVLVSVKPVTFLCWLAGFFDGEGSIHAGQRNYGEHKTIFITGALTNTNREAIDWVRSQYGGYLQVNYTSRGKACYSLVWSANQLYDVLSDIYPYLVVKKYIGGKALQFLEPYRRKTPDVQSTIKTLALEIRAINASSKRTWGV